MYPIDPLYMMKHIPSYPYPMTYLTRHPFESDDSAPAYLAYEVNKPSPGTSEEAAISDGDAALCAPKWL